MSENQEPTPAAGPDGDAAAGGTGGEPKTIVHLVRHGEVDNPGGILYGRLPGFRLSEDGQMMAKAAADFLAGRDVTVLRSSPLERAMQTAEPIAEQLGLPIEIDERLIEPWNHFEGLNVGVGDGSLRAPRHWIHLRNPFRPSWGEPYREVAARVLAAAADAAKAARGHEAVCVSHQLPIWVTRRAVEGRTALARPAPPSVLARQRHQPGVHRGSSRSWSATPSRQVRPDRGWPARRVCPVGLPGAGQLGGELPQILGPRDARPVPGSPEPARRSGSCTMGCVLPSVGDLFVTSPHRSARRPAMTLAISGLLAGAAVLGLAACSGGADRRRTRRPATGQSFVGGSYSSTYYAPGDRPPAPKVSGTTLTGQRRSAWPHSAAIWSCSTSGVPGARRAAARRRRWQRSRSTSRARPVRFIGDDVQDAPANAAAFERTFGISYPSLNDPGEQVALAFHGAVPPVGIPTTLLIDSTGHIAGRVVGEVTLRRPEGADHQDPGRAVVTRDLSGRGQVAEAGGHGRS